MRPRELRPAPEGFVRTGSGEDAAAPAEPGCYAAADGTGRVVYIGRTNSLMRRITEHLYGDGRRGPGRACGTIWYLRCAREAAAALESRWLTCHRRKEGGRLPERNRIDAHGT